MVKQHIDSYVSPKTGRRLNIPKGKGYRKGCRCDDCVRVYRERKQAERERRLRKPIPEHVHGTWNGYANYNCRCARCLDACREKYDYGAQYRELHREEKNAHRREYYRRLKAEQLEAERRRRAK